MCDASHSPYGQWVNITRQLAPATDTTVGCWDRGALIKWIGCYRADIHRVMAAGGGWMSSWQHPSNRNTITHQCECASDW
jgi:hypothetical protein